MVGGDYGWTFGMAIEGGGDYPKHQLLEFQGYEGDSRCKMDVYRLPLPKRGFD